ncbi:hypothetical protein N0438_32420, partial [Pseudomonas aeruginosa]|nr:hypothetical protein [Pseudomonas aeruginosa]
VHGVIPVWSGMADFDDAVIVATEGHGFVTLIHGVDSPGLARAGRHYRRVLDDLDDIFFDVHGMALTHPSPI